MSSLHPKPLNIAHRGASAEAPENTMAAFRRALEIGVDGIELDLHMTRDGELVVIHDDRVDRTTDGRGFVHALSLAEVRALDAGSWFNRLHPGKGTLAFAGARVPTLSEVIEWVRPTAVVLYLEIKPGPDAPPGIEARLVEVIAQSRFDTRVVIESFHHTALTSVRRLHPALRTCALFEPPVQDPLAQARQLGVEEVAPLWTLATEEFIRSAHQENRRVVAWTVDDPAALTGLMAHGIDGIITNYPSRLKQILDNR